MRGLKLHRSLTAAAAVVAALGAGAIYAAASGDSQAPTEPTERVDAGPQGKPAGTYAVLDRSDERPSGRVARLIDVVNRDFNIDPNDSRATTAADGTKVWVIPATDGICFGVAYDDGPAISCATAKEIASGRLPMSAVDRGDGNVVAHYLVADDVAALEVDGRQVEPRNNTIVLKYKRGADVTLIGRDGSRTPTGS